MAITIDHSNIASALGLAAQAGAGIRNQRVGEQDLQFLQMMQNAQSNADRDYANQIQMALGAQDKSLDNARADAQLAETRRQNDATTAYRQQQADIANKRLDSADAEAATKNGYTEQRIGLEKQHQQTRDAGQTLRQSKYDDQQQAIDDLPDELQGLMRASGGRLPYIPNSVGNDTDGKMLESEARRISALIQAEQRKQQQSAFDGKDLIGPRGQASRTVQGAALGMEQPYQQSAQAIAGYQQQLNSINGALQQKTQALINQPPGAKTNATGAAVLDYLKSLSGGSGDQKSAGSVPTVNSKADYDALPSGTTYINGKTGQSFIKP